MSREARVPQAEERLPLPVGVLVARARRARQGEAGASVSAAAFCLLRHAVVVMLAEYLRDRPDEFVERRLAQLQAPTPATWGELASVLGSAMHQRAQTHLVGNIAEWAIPPAGGGGPVRRLVALARSGDARLPMLEAILSDASWLGEHRLLRVLTAGSRPDGGRVGMVQLLHGPVELPEPTMLEWELPFEVGGVYIESPDHSVALDMRPLLDVSYEPARQTEQCLLLAGIPGLKRLTLQHDASGRQYEAHVRISGRESSWSDWRAQWGWDLPTTGPRSVDVVTLTDPGVPAPSFPSRPPAGLEPASPLAPRASPSPRASPGQSDAGRAPAMARSRSEPPAAVPPPAPVADEAASFDAPPPPASPAPRRVSLRDPLPAPPWARQQAEPSDGSGAGSSVRDVPEAAPSAVPDSSTAPSPVARASGIEVEPPVLDAPIISHDHFIGPSPAAIPPPAMPPLIDPPVVSAPIEPPVVPAPAEPPVVPAPIEPPVVPAPAEPPVVPAPIEPPIVPAPAEVPRPASPATPSPAPLPEATPLVTRPPSPAHALTPPPAPRPRRELPEADHEFLAQIEGSGNRDTPSNVSSSGGEAPARPPAGALSAYLASTRRPGLASGPGGGDRLAGRYLILRGVETGGSASLHVALDERLQREVLLRMPDPRMLADPSYRERFELETRRAMMVTHPHVAQVLDLEEDEGRPLVVLQLLDGGSLDERIRQGEPPVSSLLAWLLQVGEALDALHALGFVHREVEPRNILFDRIGNAHLADFSASRAIGSDWSRMTHLGLLPGAPAYMAPEPPEDGLVTGAYDQYSLATISFRALSGALPHEASTPMALLLAKPRIPARPLEQVSAVPPNVAAVVARALSIAPSERHESCGEFVRQLTATLRKAGLAQRPLMSLWSRSGAAPAPPGSASGEAPAGGRLSRLLRDLTGRKPQD